MNRRNFIKSMIATLVAPVAISQTPTVVATEFTCKAAEGIEPYRTGYYGYAVMGYAMLDNTDVLRGKF